MLFNPNQSLFIVEDDHRLRQMLSEYFTSQEFEVTTFDEGEAAIEKILGNPPDVVLLDLMLPKTDGLSVCRQIRAQYSGKVLILTASDDDFDHVAALEVGADDFVSKPIKPRVLLARIRMLLRREEQSSKHGKINSNSEILEYGQLRLNYTRKVCELEGKVVNISGSEFDLLWALAYSPNVVLSRDTLTKTIRGIEYDGLDRTVDNKIVSLRKKLGDTSITPIRIITVRGKGYLFVPETW